MLRPISQKTDALIALDRRQLYLVQAKFGQTIEDCISFALSADYHRTGKLITTEMSGIDQAAEMAALTDKVLVIYRHTYMDISVVGEGVGYIYLYEDLEGKVYLVCWKNSQDKQVLVSDGFADKQMRPKWRD